MADLNVNKSENTGAYENVGNVIPNSDFERAPTFTAATNTVSRWIDGTAGGSTTSTGFVWAIPTGGLVATASAQFDSSTSHSGSNSMKLTTGDATGTISVSTLAGSAAATTMYETIPLKASTKYILNAWCKTSTVASNSAFIDLRQYNASATAIATNSSNKLSGTNDWTLLTLTVTTDATCTTGTIFLRNNVAGSVGSAWFDDITLVASPADANVTIPVGVVVTPGVQDISGPKIWS